MKLTGRIAAIFTLAWLCCGLVSADQGRIPIYQPTTIKKPGAYFVTSDFGTAGKLALLVETAQLVIIDFNGHTVAGNVEFSPNAAHELQLRNGSLIGNVVATDENDAVSLGLADQQVAGDVTLNFATELRARTSRVGGTITVSGSFVRAFLSDSTFSSAVSLTGVKSSVIRNNSFSADLTLSGLPTNNMIQSNVVSGTIRLVEPLDRTLHTALFFNNAFAMEIQGRLNQLTGNLVQGSPITVAGSQNTIDGNTVQNSPSYGLVITGNDNVYRNNTLRGNSQGPTQITGTGNIDGGGNVN